MRHEYCLSTVRNFECFLPNSDVGRSFIHGARFWEFKTKLKLSEPFFLFIFISIGNRYSINKETNYQPMSRDNLAEKPMSGKKRKRYCRRVQNLPSRRVFLVSFLWPIFLVFRWAKTALHCQERRYATSTK